jgi:anti-anti-sigma factor
VEHQGHLTVARVINMHLMEDEDVQALGERLLRLVDCGCRSVMLDLGGASAVSSSVLGKVLALYKRTKAVGGRVALCGVSPRLREALEALQLTRLIPAYEGRDEGVAAMTPSP